MNDLISRQTIKDIYSGKRWHYFRNRINKIPAVDAVEMPKDNADDINLALYGLGIFRKSFCMNVKETDNQNEPIFRCGECLFEDKSSRKCAVKMFLNKYATEEERQKFLHIMW